MHFLALVIEQTDDVVNLIKLIANRLKVNLKSNPNALGLNAKCRYGRTALHQAIKSRNLIAVRKSVLHFSFIPFLQIWQLHLVPLMVFSIFLPWV